MGMRPMLLALVVLVCAVRPVVSACGSDHPVRDLRERAEQASERLKQRVQEVLDDLRKAVPEATPQTRPPSSRGRTETTRGEGDLLEVRRRVDGYWTRTLEAAGRREPRVSYVWVEPGDILRTGCGVAADDSAAFYCPSDVTVYVAGVLASNLWRGIAKDFPGQRAGYGHAVGDFGLAYVV